MRESTARIAAAAAHLGARHHDHVRAMKKKSLSAYRLEAAVLKLGATRAGE